MTNENHQNHEHLQRLQQAFRHVYQSMVNRYAYYTLGLESNPTSSSLAKGIFRYVTEFSQVGLQPEDITSHAMDIINERNFAAKPPMPREMALLIQDRITRPGNMIEEEFLQFFNKMKVRYRGLWHDDSDRQSVIDSWVLLAQKYSLEPKMVGRIGELLMSDPSFSKYPPTEKAIEQIIGIIAKGEDVTIPSRAYMTAVGKARKECKLIKFARSSFGAYALRTRTDLLVKREFEEFYSALLDDYLSGSLVLSDEETVEQSEEVQDERLLSKEEMMKMFKR